MPALRNFSRPAHSQPQWMAPRPPTPPPRSIPQDSFSEQPLPPLPSTVHFEDGVPFHIMSSPSMRPQISHSASSSTSSTSSWSTSSSMPMKHSRRPSSVYSFSAYIEDADSAPSSPVPVVMLNGKRMSVAEPVVWKELESPMRMHFEQARRDAAKTYRGPGTQQRYYSQQPPAVMAERTYARHIRKNSILNLEQLSIRRQSVVC